jgi:hypothetical protein
MGLVFPMYAGLPDFSERVWRTAGILALFGAYPTALVVGVPAYFMLLRHFRPTLINCAFAGAIVAVLPWILFSFFPAAAREASVDNRATVIDHWVTPYGWLLWGEFVVQIAAFGLVGGLAFWLVAVAGWRPADIR